MECIEAIKLRKSIRGYKMTPVPKEVLTQILEVAARAPSATNIQPWKFTVLGGEVLGELKEALQKQFLEGIAPCSDFGPFLSFGGVYRDRQVAVGKSLFQLMDIAREDKGKRTEWMLKMIRFFDAPNAIIVSIDGEINGFPSIFSLGTVSQTIALAALDFGLGTCMEQGPVIYPDVIRRVVGIPDAQKIAIAIAIGYPDWEFPANKLQSTREPLSNITVWHGI